MPLTKPTPPTPPTIDKGEATESTPRIDAHQFFEVPFKREQITEEIPVAKPVEKSTEKPVEKKVETPPQIVERKVTTPEDMARDAVANGAGALTKKTITRPDAETNSPASNNPATSNAHATANLPITNDRQSRGKEILREFQNEDRQTLQTVETPRPVKINHNESYSGFYWIGMIVFAGILSIIFVRKFLVKKNPKLKKSDLFEDADKRLQAVSEKVSAPKVNPVSKNPASNIKSVEKITTSKINSAEKVATKKSPPKNDDDKGKHFEVRI